MTVEYDSYQSYPNTDLSIIRIYNRDFYNSSFEPKVNHTTLSCVKFAYFQWRFDYFNRCTWFYSIKKISFFNKNLKVFTKLFVMVVIIAIIPIIRVDCYLSVFELLIISAVYFIHLYMYNRMYR